MMSNRTAVLIILSMAIGLCFPALAQSQATKFSNMVSVSGLHYPEASNCDETIKIATENLKSIHYRKACAPKADSKLPDSVSKVEVTGCLPAEEVQGFDKGVVVSARVWCRASWTPWLDRDNPGGSGDFETLRDFLEAGQACECPLDIECQTTSGKSWQSSGQVYECSKMRGGICKNSEQTGSRGCLDYRVRFQCQPPGKEVCLGGPSQIPVEGWQWAECSPDGLYCATIVIHDDETGFHTAQWCNAQVECAPGWQSEVQHFYF